MQGNKELRAKLGQIVSAENSDNWWRPELFEKHTRQQIPTEIEIITPPPSEEDNYNCFIYALGLQNDPHFLGLENWDFTSNLGVVFDEMIDQGILTRTAKGDVGNLIIYRTDKKSISHIGIIDDGGKVVSKWSWGPLLRHDIYDVPDHYGDVVEFYKIGQEAKNFVFAKRVLV